MHFQYLKPSAMLCPFIRHYWVMESGPSEMDVTERVIPTGNIQLMFHYKKPFIVCHPDRSQTRQGQSIISGLSGSYCDVTTNGETGVIAVEFLPAGASHFFPFPMDEVENQSVALADIYGREIREVEQRIGEVGDLKEKVRIIEAFLMKRFCPITGYNEALIRTGVGFIKQNRGQVAISALASHLFVSPKSLERKFSAYLGKTPKQFIKLVRFHEVILDIERNRMLDLTEIAYRNGYFDQSHFIREFKTYSGYTPKEYLVSLPCDHIDTDFGC